VNYEDERYVRLYTRNTPTWCSWKWEARAVLPLLLRVVDRDGRLEWPKGDDALSVAAVLMMPVKVVVVAMRELARTGTIKTGDGWLEFPNFVDGQNSKGRAKSGAERMAELRERRRSGGLCADVTSVTKSDECDHSAVLCSAQLSPTSIEPFGLSPENPPAADVPGKTEGAQILTHPTAGDSAGRVATQRRRAAVELWDWHESERIRRLLSGQHKPRKGTDKSLGPVLRLHAHVRKAYDCDEAEAWARIRAYREARLEETERALREGHPQADKWRGYAAGEAAWSHKGFDYLEQRGADPRAAKAASDAEFQALVAARKRGES
jgi:hypothetical protein